MTESIAAQVATVCPTCGGEGWHNLSPDHIRACKTCRGKGRVAQGTEARRGETACGLDAKHDGPVAEGDAPKPRYEGQERRHTRRLSDPVRTLDRARLDIARRALAEIRDILRDTGDDSTGRCLRVMQLATRTLRRLEDE
jgi:hypothetical protein